MGDLGWLTRRPVAHRGLHDAASGIIENTPSAVDAALAGGFAIEVDVQLSADGEAMVFHDDTLDRLTLGTGPLANFTADTLQTIPFKATADRMLRLPELLERVGGRAPLLIELKSGRARNDRLAERAADLVCAYRGEAALMSFDPRLLVTVRRRAPGVVRGIVAEQHFGAAEWAGFSTVQRLILGQLLHWPFSRFQYVAYRVGEVDALAPQLMRRLGLPLLAWTVRTPQDRERAGRYADQMIFENFRP